MINELEKPVLSVCIPVYNRKSIFKSMLTEVCKSAVNLKEKVEIVISDNASEDNLFEVVQETNISFPNVNIRYFRNEVNIGLAANFIEVVKKAFGQFCWIVGSDDFLKKNSIAEVIRLIEENIEVDLFVVNKDSADFGDDFNFLDNPSLYLENSENLSFWSGAPKESFKTNTMNNILHPRFNNVLLGAMMVNIFRRSKWNSVEISASELQNFNSLISIYPHCYIFSRTFFGSICYFEANHMITTCSYNGMETWQSSSREKFWLSKDPNLYFNVLPDLLENYYLSGLEDVNYKEIKKIFIQYPARLVVPIFVRRYIYKRSILHGDRISLTNFLRKNFLNPYVYFGIIKGAIKFALRKKIY
jgi:hypothetical protein